MRFREQRGLAASQIFFILGADAFAEIETWNRYPEVLDLANFVVVSRPGYDIGASRRVCRRWRRAVSVAPDGRRRAIDPDAPRFFSCTAATPDVSSTDIRQRLRAGDRSPASSRRVEQHIRQHGSI